MPLLITAATCAALVTASVAFRGRTDALTTASPKTVRASVTSVRHIARRSHKPIRHPARLTRAFRRRWDCSIHGRPSRGQFERFYRVTATAYRPINTRMEGGRWTKTQGDGRARHGVAVDPDLIPLGSHLWIPGYGHAIADDTGGRIKGHHVDLRVQEHDQMDDWGTRPVRVYVLRDPE